MGAVMMRGVAVHRMLRLKNRVGHQLAGVLVSQAIEHALPVLAC